MITVFKSRIPQDIKDLEIAFEKQDIELLKQKAHMLAGSLGSLQFQKGTILAQEIEDQAMKDDKEQAIQNTGKLILYLKEALITVD